MGIGSAPKSASLGSIKINLGNTNLVGLKNNYAANEYDYEEIDYSQAPDISYEEAYDDYEDMDLETRLEKLYDARDHAQSQEEIDQINQEIDNTIIEIINTEFEDDISSGYLLDNNMYTDDFIDSLNISDDYKDIIKKCIQSEDIGSMLLVSCIIDTSNQLSSIEQELSDNSITSEREEELEALKKQLTVSLATMEQELNLMQYQSEFAAVSSEKVEYDSVDYIKDFFALHPGLLDEMMEESRFNELREQLGEDISDEEIAAILLLDLFDNTFLFSRTPGEEFGNSFSCGFMSMMGDVDINVLALLDIYCNNMCGDLSDTTRIPQFISIDFIEVLAWEYFTVEERNVYDKIFEEQGALAAYQFVLDMQDEINRRWAYDQALGFFEEVIGNPTEFQRYISEGRIGIEQGLKTHFENIGALFSGDDSTTVTEYATEYFMQFMANAYSVAELGEIDSDKLTELYEQVEIVDGEEVQIFTQEQYEQLLEIINENGSVNGYDILYVKGLIDQAEYDYATTMYHSEEFEQFLNSFGGDREEFLANCFYSAGNSIGNMLPSIFLGAIGGHLGTAFSMGKVTVGWGQILANMSMFLSSAGGSWKEASQAGNDNITSLLYGLLSGGSEVTVGFFLGRIPFVSRISKVTENFVEGQGNIIIHAGLALLSDIGGEVAEEVSQVFIEGGLKKIVLKEDVTMDDLLAQIPETIVSTIISTGAINGTTTVIQIGATEIYVGKEDAINMLLSRNCEEYFRAIIASQTNNTEVLDEIINNNRISEREIAAIIQKMTDDLAKVRYISKINNQKVVDALALSLKDENAIREILPYVSDDVRTLLENHLNNNYGSFDDADYDITDKIPTAEIINSFAENDLITVQTEVEATAESVSLNLVEKILTDRNYFYAFMDYKNNQSMFGNSQEAIIQAVRIFYESIAADCTVTADGMIIDNKTGKAYSRNIYNVYLAIMQQSSAIKSFRAIYTDGKYSFFRNGDIATENVSFIDSSLLTDDGYYWLIHEIERCEANGDNTSAYSYLSIFHSLYNDAMKAELTLDADAIKRLNTFERMYQELINSHRGILAQYSEFGANQHAIARLVNNISINPALYASLEKIVKKYFPKIKRSNIITLLRGIDYKGVCSYATVINELLIEYEGREAQFRSEFGFDLYRYENGKVVVNTEEILADLYCFVNRRNPKIFEGGWFNQTIGTDANQYGLSYGRTGKAQDAINDWLRSKGINAHWESRVFFFNSEVGIGDLAVQRITEQIASLLASGNQVELGLAMDENNPIDFSFYPTDEELRRNQGLKEHHISETHHRFGHSVAVVGIDTNGDLIVSSWGREYIVKWEDLRRLKITMITSSLVHY